MSVENISKRGMTESIILRDKPELEFKFNIEEFELLDLSEPKNNGTYLYSQIKNVKLNKRKTNWIITILSYIIELVLGTGGGGKYKKERTNNND